MLFRQMLCGSPYPGSPAIRVMNTRSVAEIVDFIPTVIFRRQLAIERVPERHTKGKRYR